MSASPAPYGVAEFIADAKRIVPAGGGDPGPDGRAALGQCLSRLAGNQELRERMGIPTQGRGTHGMDIRGSELHREPDGTLVLMFARFPHEAETPVHNHNSWGVVCVVHGRDRYLAWRRTDDASRDGHAEVELVEERILGPGEFIHFGDVPNEDIHSQQGWDGAPVWELVFFGRDPNVKPRLYFDPAARTVTAAPAVRSR